LQKTTIGTLSTFGTDTIEISGVYRISNLLQELTLASGYGNDSLVLPVSRIQENPVARLVRVIKEEFWDNLTRTIDGSTIEKVASDKKDWTENPQPRIYVPKGAPEIYEYYCRLSKARPEINLEVLYLPDTEKITGEYVRDLNDKPGLLAIAMKECTDVETGKKTMKGLPFIVPGGRFNELYGWDSYMESLGLLVSKKLHLAKSMVTHFCFCIRHYGKIFNANRSYYLGRSQPPFLTDMALRVFQDIPNYHEGRDFLRVAFQAAIKEYYGIWMSEPRLDPETGLSRYRPTGKGIPPETERSHFDHILKPYAEKHGLPHDEFVNKYNSGEIEEPDLDEYLLHDRAVRESGHDTSYRLEKVAANLATIDLNSLLFKYETDIAFVIKTFFNDELVIPAEYCTSDMTPGQVEKSETWRERAQKRREAVDKYLWNDEKGMYFDYDTVNKEQRAYESATTFWAMWAGLASKEQAKLLVTKALPKLEMLGGLASGTLRSRGQTGLDRPNRQWDYPYGWAPQQMLAWDGLKRYGFTSQAARLAYRWLWMVTKAFYEHNGVVVEKYNVTTGTDSHKVDAEYGNQGSEFTGVAREGFGWVNASYVYGLTFLDEEMIKHIGELHNWDEYIEIAASA
jgi:alpha,alpha-trehalase